MDRYALIVAALSWLLCGFLSWLALNRRIHEGLVAKMGLTVAAMGLLLMPMVLMGMEVPRPLLAVLVLVMMGVSISVYAALHRILATPETRKAAKILSGWHDLERTESAEPS